MLILGLLTRVAFRVVVTGDLLLLIALPMRAVLPELMLILGLLPIVTFRVVVTGDLLLVIELPMREVLPELMLILGLLPVVTLRVVVTGDFFSPMDLAIRTVLFELMRLLELTVVCFLALEFTPADLLPLERLVEGLRALEVIGGRRVVVRLDVTLLDLVRLDVLAGLGLTIVLVLWTPPGELLRLGDLEVLTAVRDLVTREEAVDCVRAFLALEDCRALGAAEVFLAGWLF